MFHFCDTIWFRVTPALYYRKLISILSSSFIFFLWDYQNKDSMKDRPLDWSENCDRVFVEGGENPTAQGIVAMWSEQNRIKIVSIERRKIQFELLLWTIFTLWLQTFSSFFLFSIFNQLFEVNLSIVKFHSLCSSSNR